MKLWRSTLEGIALTPHRRFEPRVDQEIVPIPDRQSALALLNRIASNPLHMEQLRGVLARWPDHAALSLRSDADVLGDLASQLERGSLRAEITRAYLPPPRLEEDPKDEKKEEQPEQADHDVEFEITDDFGDPFSAVKYTLIYPDGSRKEGTLGSDGRVKETSVPQGTYRLELKLASNARWSSSKIVVGEPVKLIASTTGFPEGASGSFEIYDYRGLHRDKLISIDGKVSARGNLEGEWTPTSDDARAVGGGKVLFVATIEGATAMSPRVPLLVKQEFELEDDKGPVADTTMVTCFTSGYQTTVPVKGGKAEILVRAGDKLAWINLPDHPGAYIKVDEEDGASRALYLPDATDNLPDATDNDAPSPEA
jgi:hypothetical protein